MEIRQRLMSDMKTAMKEKDQARLDAIRFLQAAIKYKEIELRPNSIAEKDVMDVIKKLVKQRKEAMEQYSAVGRQDMVDKEIAELKILELYLPTQMDRSQVEGIVSEVIAEIKASSIKDMGAVMKAVAAKTQGAADNKMVSEIVKSKLNP